LMGLEFFQANRNQIFLKEEKFDFVLFFSKINFLLTTFHGSISLYFFINWNIRYYLFRYFL
jgi:hypothetical protein